MFRSRRTLTAESSRESQHKQRRRGSTAAPESSQSRCKRSAFDHSSGKPRQHCGSTQTVSKEPKVRTIREVDDDDDLNSGFASYMRSGAGLEMMKLFILGNTLIIVVTFAWPHIYESIKQLRSWYAAQPS